MEDVEVLKNILGSATYEKHCNQYIFRENDEIDKKYYVVMRGIL